MNLCFLLGGFTENGGIGRVTSILANSLSDDLEYQIFTLSFFDNHRANLYDLNARISQNYLFNQPLNMTKGILLGGILNLRKYLEARDIDIIIACGALYYPISVLGCRGLKTKCICWEHSNVQNSKDHAYQNMCRWFGAKYADHVVALTKYDQRSFVNKYNTSSISQIYNPIDNNLGSHVHEYSLESQKIISVGRLSYQKNFGLLVEIAKYVLGENPNWTWDIYGEGDQREQLETKITEYDLGDKLILKGQVDDLYDRYHEYSMLVMTSRYEGFPMSLLEAMANGLPLISFDVLTGPNEIIENGVNGYLIAPFNVDEMVLRINNLISNPLERFSLSDAGKNMVSKYHLKAIVAQWQQLFVDQIRNKSRTM